MLENSNLLYILLASVPGILYIFSFFANSCKETNTTLNFPTSFRFLLNGIMSAILVLAFLYVFPNWQDEILLDNRTYSIAFLSFFQIAFLEELIKFILIRLSLSQYDKKLTLMQTFFYCSLISCGFAIAENFMYLLNYGPSILLSRALTAIPAHVILGIIMSYFIVLATIKLKSFRLQSLALIIPVAIHGLYDFNVILSSEIPSKHTSTNAVILMVIILISAGSLAAFLIQKIKNLKD